MPRLSIEISEEEKKILKKRADKNFLSLCEQAEDIIRRSCISAKRKTPALSSKVDDALVGIFSRQKTKKKKKK